MRAASLPPYSLAPCAPCCRLGLGPALQVEEHASSNRWHKEREAKREADWDSRLKEAYKWASTLPCLPRWGMLPRPVDWTHICCHALSAPEHAPEG